MFVFFYWGGGGIRYILINLEIELVELKTVLKNESAHVHSYIKMWMFTAFINFI